MESIARVLVAGLVVLGEFSCVEVALSGEVAGDGDVGDVDVSLLDSGPDSVAFLAHELGFLKSDGLLVAAAVAAAAVVK